MPWPLVTRSQGKAFAEFLEHAALYTGMTAGSLPKRAALLFAMLFPSLATYLYFVAFAGSPAMRVVFAAGKLAQFAFPLVWILLVEHRRPRFFAGGARGLGAGLALGALI